MPRDNASGVRTIGTLMRRAPLAVAVDFAKQTLQYFTNQIAPALILKGFFDLLAGDRSATGDIALTFGLVLGAWFLSVIGDAMETWSRPLINEGLAGLIRGNLLGALLDRPATRRPKTPPAGTLSLFRRETTEITSFVDQVGDISVSAAAFAVSVGILARESAVATLLCLLPLALAPAAGALLSKWVEARKARWFEASASWSALLGAAVDGAESIAAASAEGAVVAAISRRAEEHRKAKLRVALAGHALESVFSFPQSLATALVLLVASLAGSGGKTVAGDLALFVTMIPGLGTFTGFVGQALTWYRQAALALRRLRDAFGFADFGPIAARQRRPSRPEADPAGGHRAGGHILECHDLSCVHKDSGQGAQGVDLHLGPGTLTVVTGPTGSGKSTLLRALAGLAPLSGGSILWDGTRVDDPEAFLVPPRLSWVGQSPGVFAATVGENVRMGLAGRDGAEGEARLERAIAAAALARDLDALEAGLDTDAGPGGARLSGGQRQRVALARALATGSAILVLDDPTSALDKATELAVWKALKGLRGVSTLAASNSPAALRAADWALVLEDGRVAAFGRPAELAASHPFVRELLGAGQGAPET
ncbi:MAG: ABC transporter ATP-binding protein [Spirochaetia bacterium]|nr:ABC transporter ATP-binding protein [Spirochaetia bacterium]